MNVEEEVGRLKEEIKRLGKPQADGSYTVISYHIVDLIWIWIRQKEF